VETICIHVNGVLADKHWKQKFRLSDSTWQSIDWYGLGRAYKESSTATRRWATKHTSGFFAHGKNMARWNFCSSTCCPQCNKEVKDKVHITQCPNAEASLTWQQSLKQLEKWFQESNTAHKLSEAILWDLHQWQDPQRNVASPTGPYIMDQVVIGWDQFLDGWLAKSWWLHQEAAWQGVRSCRSS